MPKPLDPAQLLELLRKHAAGAVPRGAADESLKRVYHRMVEILGTARTAEHYREFERDLEARLVRIERLEGTGDFIGLAREAHDFSSTAGNLGYSDLADLGRTIEGHCRTGDTGGARRRVRSLAAAAAAAKRALAAVLDRSGGSGQPAQPHESPPKRP